MTAKSKKIQEWHFLTNTGT